MSPPADPESTPQRWRWLDRWLALRWRALATWIALALVSVLVECSLWQNSLLWISTLPERLSSRFLSVTLPSSVAGIAFWVNAALLLVWFEPLLLRLNWLRSMAWLGLRIAPLFAGLSADGDTAYYRAVGACLAGSVLQVPVLWGWRNRPWMAVVSMALAIGMFEVAVRVPVALQNLWWILIGLSIAYAVPLICGTRLLRAEEKRRNAQV